MSLKPSMQSSTLMAQSAEASITYCQLQSSADGSNFQSAIPECSKIWVSFLMLIALIMLLLLLRISSYKS